jgi:alpha-galactosidase
MTRLHIVHLTAAGVSLLLTQEDSDLPVIAYWGAAIEASDADLVAFATAGHRPGLDGVSDIPYRPSVLPEHGRGWFGRPGLSVHRAGTAWAPRLETVALALDAQEVAGDVVQSGPGTITATAKDAWARLEVGVDIELTPSGLLIVGARVRNTADDAEPLDVLSVAPHLPLPVRAREVLDFSGRWAHERLPQRHPVVHGSHARTSRRGRTGLDATGVVAVGVPGFTSDTGEVWVCHVGFSGNHEHAVDRDDTGLAFRGSEVLLPGEVRLAGGEEYATPQIFGAYGDGTDAAAARFHAQLRGLSRSSLRPRPVTLNVWEAVYFAHDREVLGELAARAADLGVERFVLDDGWFRNRKDDRAGLGDWEPDPDAWPDGLRPLADEVRSLGMEFGLWVEPEMINEDSDLARAHPDWILRSRPELPARYRFQQVLDLTNPEAYAHILGRLDALVSEIDLAYLKWDHNRDLVAAGHPATGSPAVHEQTLAVYRLLDELRARHPRLEIESCASGGGRVDLGILARTDRIHPSDSHDPVDRFHNLRWTGLLVPPEMMGSHVASAVSHVTGRTHDLELRCAVAFLGHFGLEWDLRALSTDEREVLKRWISDHRRFRGLIQSGTAVTGGAASTEPALRGVVAPDRSEALYSVLTPSATMDAMSSVRLPGLDPQRRYRITASTPGPLWAPDWLRRAPGLGETGEAPVLTGAVLTGIGLDFPTSHPDRAVVLHLAAVD